MAIKETIKQSPNDWFHAEFPDGDAPLIDPVFAVSANEEPEDGD